ncbi:hypothetical protein LXA43DRAFT_1099074 [Ganoderma leucocontextum]|nr:hypothetical protein LXA43DRAFT_1099074 [Ganoderma leucocontextum]
MQNKEQSEKAEEILKHQGYKGDTGVEHIEAEADIGGKKVSEHRRNRRVAVGELEVESLRVKEGWLPETFVDGAITHFTADGDPAKGSEATWHIQQAWDFQLVEGQKKYVRRIHFVGPKGAVLKGMLVYDYDESFNSGLDFGTWPNARCRGCPLRGVQDDEL